MFNSVAKICILCLICEVMELASSLPLKHPLSDLHSEVRVKRSPNDSALFGYKLPFLVPNPSEKIKDTLSNFRHIFVTERKNVGTSSEYAFSDIKTKKKHNGTHIMSLVEGESTNKKLEDIKPIHEANHNFSEYHIDKKLIDDIFKELMNDNIHSENLNNIIQENSERLIEEQLKRIFKETRSNNIIRGDITSTADPNVDTATDVSETNEYETTTTDDLLRINPSLVASLLG